MSATDDSPGAEKKARFEDLLDFPTAFTFRVVCAALPRMAEDAARCLERLTGEAAVLTSSQPSRTGKWTVHRIEATVHDADQIRAAYTELAALSGVRMVL